MSQNSHVYFDTLYITCSLLQLRGCIFLRIPPSNWTSKGKLFFFIPFLILFTHFYSFPPIYSLKIHTLLLWKNTYLTSVGKKNNFTRGGKIIFQENIHPCFSVNPNNLVINNYAILTFCDTSLLPCVCK